MSTEAKKFKSELPKIGTHDGTFHCDEVIACFMLKKTAEFKNAEIVRSRDPEVIKTCDIVVDVGRIFSPEENLFDHHQGDFKETLSSLRPELGDQYNIRLSSAGLVYTYFGEEVISNILKEEKAIVLSKSDLKALYKKVYESFMQEIDAIDNGVQICDGEPLYHIKTDLSSRVGQLNPEWNCEKFDQTELFEKASKLVSKEFTDKVVHIVSTWLPAREIVIEAIKNAKSVHESGEILELAQFCPWQAHLFDLEKEFGMEGVFKYVIFSEKGKNWRVRAVSNTPSSFICRKFLHKDWRGLSADKISEISGIPNIIFCHATGFIGGGTDRESTLRMAIESLNGSFTN